MTIDLHERIREIPIPARMQWLPRNDKGWIVPRFVQYVDDYNNPKPFGHFTGHAEFRIMDSEHLRRCVKEHRCWVCAGHMGRFKAFVIGPMCSINRASSEPPSHRECAIYAAKACPFLTMPKMTRRQDGLPEGMQRSKDQKFDDTHVPGGVGILRNPGVALVWIIDTAYTLEIHDDGQLFRLPDPAETLWFCEGRIATRDEIMNSIASGMPLLEEMANKQDGEEGGTECWSQLQQQYRKAMRYVPGSPEAWRLATP